MTSDPSPSPPREDCPAPLRWQEVLRAFHEQSATRQIAAPIRNGERRLTIRTLGEGPPLYFLTGSGNDSEWFCLLVWLLKDHFRCVLCDAVPLDERSVDAAARELFAVADALGDRELSIYAVSFGCAAALTAMLASPRITRAVLQGGFARREWSRFERMLCALGRRSPGEVRRLPFWNSIQSVNHRPWFPPNDPERWGFYLDRAGRLPIRRLAEQCSSFDRFDLRARVSEVRQPTLLIRTENEGRVANAAVDALAAGMPHARVEPFHSAGQLPHLTHPHRLAKSVRAFLYDESSETNCPALNVAPEGAGLTEPRSIHA